MAVADDCGYAIERGDLRWGALGVAAGNDDFRFWVEAAGLAQEGAGVAVGLRGDAAGIDDDHAGFAEGGLGHAAGAQAVADRFTVGAGCAAAEILDVEACHPLQDTNQWI